MLEYYIIYTQDNYTAERNVFAFCHFLPAQGCQALVAYYIWYTVYILCVWLSNYDFHAITLSSVTSAA